MEKGINKKRIVYVSYGNVSENQKTSSQVSHTIAEVSVTVSAAAASAAVILNAAIGWQTLPEAETEIIFKIWRVSSSSKVMIYSAKDSCAGAGVNKLTTFVHVDTSMDAGFTASQGIEYVLTADTPRAENINCIEFTAATTVQT